MTIFLPTELVSILMSFCPSIKMSEKNQGQLSLRRTTDETITRNPGTGLGGLTGLAQGFQRVDLSKQQQTSSTYPLER